MIELSALLDTGVSTASARTAQAEDASSSRSTAALAEADSNDSATFILAQSPAEGLPEIARAAAFLPRNSAQGVSVEGA